jgi:phosphoglycolate phosphatase-like HAD superfamily hydrolase
MQVCLFDIDGTLLASGGAGKAAMEAALVSQFGVPEPVLRVQYSGRTDRAICRDLLQFHGVDESPENWTLLRTAYLSNLPDYLARHQGRILPGIQALLEHLESLDHVVVGLLTGNLREGARIKLSHYGLFHYFAFGGYGDDHICRDDVAREALMAVHDHCNGSAAVEQLWVIGDTPLDIRCARAIGAKVAAVATGFHPPEELQACGPDLLFTDLSDHERLLRTLN